MSPYLSFTYPQYLNLTNAIYHASFVHILLLTLYTFHTIKMILGELVAWTMRWTSRYSCLTIFLPLLAIACSV
ncbi:hypothetical protein BDR04DRAFT_1227590 [Suillus decipiens]|nr:hypothetical protein BDR04DRAFT_1227590 [Suillus decipiens]